MYTVESSSADKEITLKLLTLFCELLKLHCSFRPRQICDIDLIKFNAYSRIISREELIDIVEYITDGNNGVYSILEFSINTHYVDVSKLNLKIMEYI